jgi:hypothetical protein
MPQKNINHNHTAAIAEAFFIGNLLFVGVFYLALWALYFLRYKKASAITQRHLQQALIGSSISTAIFIFINIFIMFTSGYASVSALFSLEFYFMLILPMFLLVGIIAFSRAIKRIDFSYPLINRFVREASVQ